MGWDGFWCFDTAKVLQQLTLIGINNCLEDDGNATS